MPTPVSRPSTPPRTSGSASDSDSSSAPSTPRRSRSPSPEAGLSGLNARDSEPGTGVGVSEFAMRTHQQMQVHQEMFQISEREPDLYSQLLAEIRTRAGAPLPYAGPAVDVLPRRNSRESLAAHSPNLWGDRLIMHSDPTYTYSPIGGDPLAGSFELVRQHPIGFQPTTAPAPPSNTPSLALIAAMDALDALDANNTTHFRLPDQHRLAGEVLMRAYNGSSHAQHTERPADSVFLRGEVPSLNHRQLLRQVIYDVRSWSEPMPPTPTTFSFLEQLRHASEDMPTTIRGIQQGMSQFIRQHNFLRRGD
jgi:hypothetical protein